MCKSPAPDSVDQLLCTVAFDVCPSSSTGTGSLSHLLLKDITPACGPFSVLMFFSLSGSFASAYNIAHRPQLSPHFSALLYSKTPAISPLIAKKLSLTSPISLVNHPSSYLTSGTALSESPPFSLAALPTFFPSSASSPWPLGLSASECLLTGYSRSLGDLIQAQSIRSHLYSGNSQDCPPSLDFSPDSRSAHPSPCSALHLLVSEAPQA